MLHQKLNGIHAGWVSVKSYVDAHGNIRYKAETLVAGSDINKKPNEGTTSTISRTGTVSVSSGQTTVTGVGTSFSSQLSVGDAIRIDTSSYVYGTVAAIANNTSLTLAAAASAAKSGKTFVKLVANTTPYTDDTDSSTFFQGA